VSGSVSDPFGGTASIALPLAIRNRSPVVKEPLASTSVPHLYDASSLRYRASANGALFEDPDGDPLVPSVVGSAFCSSVTMVSGRAVVGCDRVWDYKLGGVPPLAELLVPRTLSVTASDGWEAASSATAVTVLDRPATVAAPITSIERCTCVSGFPCWTNTTSIAAIPIPVELTDPDGDPSRLVMQVFWATGPQPAAINCVPGWCYPTVNGAMSAGQGIVQAYADGTGANVQAFFEVLVTCGAKGTCCTRPP
jgi:hypothetical protein